MGLQGSLPRGANPVTYGESEGALADVFLSYNREDQATADQFVQGIEAAGLSVWWDRRLRAGEAYDEVTENALRTARAVVVLWSQRSVASRWVRAEATLAQRGGNLVPCMIEPCERPIMFELVQTEDLSHWRGDRSDPTWQAFMAHLRDVTGKGARAEVATDLPPPGAAPEASKPLASERRQITFVSAELDRGDQLSLSTDPEDWHEFLTGLQSACRPAIERYGGRANWRGHRATITFGFPLAMEDAAQRAVRTSQDLLLAVSQLKSPARSTDARCELKIGIHASDMLVSVSGEEAELVGDGAGVSEGARDLAPPGSIHVTAAIRELASNAFHMERADHSFHDQPLYRVSRDAPVAGSSRGWETGAQIGFVGREDEVAHMRRRWNRTLDSEGQFVLIRGEPGIGKSRLVEHLRKEIADEEPAWFTLQGSSLFPNTPFYALGQALRLAIEDEAGNAQDALARRLEWTSLAPQLAPLLAPVIGLEPVEGDGAALPGDEQYSQLLALLANAVFELTERRPVVLCLEDLQWFDPSTLELVQMLIEQGGNERLLVLGTARPEFEPPWMEADHHSRINLSRLSKSQVRELVSAALGQGEVEPEILRAILDKSDGVPLFAEELARLAARHGPGATVELPPTLRSLLSARMDRLGQARELLQLCSVLGTCSYAVLAAISDLAPVELDAQLRKLTEEQLLNVRGARPHSSYRFKHALLQDGAYETLTRKRRKQLHALAAETIIEQFPDLAEREKELIATHWSRAGETERAVAAWLDAGQREFIRGASRESAALLRKGLELIGDLPEGRDRDRQEMELWSALNNALQQSLGYSNPQAIEAADKATDLAEKLGLMGKVIIGKVQLWRGLINSGAYDRADEVADRINQLASEQGDDIVPEWMPFFSGNALIQTAYYNGRLDEFEEPYASLEKLFGQYQGMFSVNDDVVAMGVASLAAWASGRSALARERSARAVEVAEGSGQPYAVAVAHHFAGTMMAFDGDMPAARMHTEKALEACEKNGIEFIGHLVRAKIGWLRSDAAPSEENVQAMRQILEAMVAANGRIGLVINMNRLAMALEARDEIEEAHKTACDALEANPLERIVRSETLQIKARLEERMGNSAVAEADLRAATALAKEMGTLAFELSAAVELAGLLERGGRGDEALAMLDEVLARCGPEIDTPALADAAALRSQLAQQNA